MDLIDTLELKDRQPDAVRARGRDVSVEAGAGSGKTKTLVARYLSLLDDGYPPRSIVAITFTKKAAREMRNRIREAVHAWATGGCPPEERERWNELEADIDAARIGTIHSLCEAILRAHPAEAGIDPGFDVLDEGLAAALKRQMVQDALSWANGQRELAPLFEAFETGTLERITSILLDQRLEASNAFAEADLPAKWAQALRTQLNAFAAQTDASMAQLAELAKGDLLADAGDKLAEQVDGFLARWASFRRELAGGEAILAAANLFALRREHCGGTTGKKTSRAKALVKEFREAYDASVDPWLGGKEKADAPPDPALERRTADAVPMLASLYAHALASYQSAKDLRHTLDFDDLEASALKLLRDREIRSRWQAQIQALLVDEFQDTNDRQRQIVEALAGTHDGLVGRLFVVGDAKQSIYRFRGADVAVFRDLDRAIAARGGLPITLNRTYRAHAGLVNALNEILAAAMASQSPYAVPFQPLTPDRDAPAPKVSAPYVEFLYGLGPSGDAARASAPQLLASRLLRLRAEEEFRWDQIALLFRASTGFPEYEQALESAGIPFVTVAGRGFYDRPEIRDLLNILRALADPWNDLALAGLLRSPAFGVSDEGLFKLRWSQGRETPAAYRSAIRGDLSFLSEADRNHAAQSSQIVERLVPTVDRVSVAVLLKQVLDATLYPAILASEDAGARLQRNVDKLLADAQASNIVGVGEFLEYVESLRDAGAREGEAPSEAGGAVRLMTIHKAKGLQFPVVVLADASRQRPAIKDPVLLSPALGLVPNPSRSEAVPLSYQLAKAIEREQSDAEDLRLLYVAATRVREKLIVCGHRPDRASSAWLGLLASAAGLDLSALPDHPGEWQTITLPDSRQTIRGMAQIAQASPAKTGVEERQKAALSDEEPLYKPLPEKKVEQVDQKEQDRLESEWQLRRVVGRGRRPDGTVLGTLVHAAIHRWKFPGDAGLDELLHAEALMEGLVDPGDRGRTIAAAKELLARFRADARFAEIDSAAQRLHEVPFSLLDENDLPSPGIVDLIYRDQRGQWQIVEFKTDEIREEGQFQKLRGKYASQVMRYREAVRRLLGQPAEAWLCFLNYASTVRWELGQSRDSPEKR